MWFLEKDWLPRKVHKIFRILFHKMKQTQKYEMLCNFIQKWCEIIDEHIGILLITGNKSKNKSDMILNNPKIPTVCVDNNNHYIICT